MKLESKRVDFWGYLSGILAFILCSSIGLSATFTWNGSDGGLWSVGGNWDQGTVPGASDIVTIDSAASNQTIYIDSTVTTAGTPYKISGLNLSEATAGVSNIIWVKRAGGSATSASLQITSSTTFGNGSDPTAISEIYLDPSLGYRSASGSGLGSNVSFVIGNVTGSGSSTSADGTLTLDVGGKLVIDSYAYNDSGTSRYYVSLIYGSVTVDGGSIYLARSYNSGITSNPALASQITGDLTINSGTLTMQAGDGKSYPRLQVNGTFKMDGGSIVIDLTGATTSSTTGLAAGPPTLLLYGASNSIGSGVSIDKNTQMYLINNGDASFTTDSFVPYLAIRGSGDNKKTVTSNYTPSSGTQFGFIQTNLTSGTTTVAGIGMGQGTAYKTTTFALGSNISTTGNISAGWGASKVTVTVGTDQYSLFPAVGFSIDLGGYNLTISNATFAPNNVGGTSNTANNNTVDNLSYGTGNSPSNWYVTNTGSGNGMITANAYDFTYSAQVFVGYNSATTTDSSGYTIFTSGSSSANPVILRATASGATNKLGGGLSGAYNPTSRFWYTGAVGSTSASSTVTSTVTVGKIEVGDGSSGSTASILKIASGAVLTAAGDVKVNANSKLDLNGQQLKLTGSAGLTGSGTITSGATGASIVFASGATGGFSPGGTASSVDASGNFVAGADGIGSVGTITFTTSTNFASTGVTLASTSVSTFDISSGSVYDVVNLGGVVIVKNGQLALNFLSGYNPNVGDSFTILTNQGASSSGSFASITSNLAGYTFSETFSGTNEIITVLSIPEPSIAALLGVASAGWAGVALLRRRLRKSDLR